MFKFYTFIDTRSQGDFIFVKTKSWHEVSNCGSDGALENERECTAECKRSFLLKIDNTQLQYESHVHEANNSLFDNGLVIVVKYRRNG